MDLLNVWDYEAAAAAKLDAGAYGYFAGGSRDEITLRDNLAAFGRWQLRPRVLVDVAGCTTETTVLGQALSMPLMVAPMAYQRVAHPDGEVGMASAARDAGVGMCLSTFATATIEEVAATGVPRWFQLYPSTDTGVNRERLTRVREAGFTALVLTVDAPVVGGRERDYRSGFSIPSEMNVPVFGHGGMTPDGAFAGVSASLTWPDVERLGAESGLPVVLKGIFTAEDAQLACEHGAAAVVVSNHGGRQLDGVAASIDVLPEVLEAIDGRMEVLVDGGVRRGIDIAKALALGARAVLVGRPALWGLTVDGEAGARRVLELLQGELRYALQLLGVNSPAEVTRAHVARRRD
jgi:isopentenyl diphosphate isomerase/L-lactate dehydrogenase-like FMN-dependent dehydrogenase